MRIGIYNDSSGGGIGGSEYCVAVLAEAFESEHDVTILHHKELLSLAVIQDAFSVRLRHARLSCSPRIVFTDAHERLPFRRLDELKAWQAELSSPFDVFFAIVGQIPPYCHARHGALLVLFPWSECRSRWDPDNGGWRLSPKRMLKGWYRRWEWQRRFRSYDVNWAISDYTQRWTRRRWGTDCEVVYPPVDCRFVETAKEPLILSVGRFRPLKKQLELLMAFDSVAKTGLKGWEFICVGGLSEHSSDQAYFAECQELASKCNARLLPNADRGVVVDLLQRASIFWHGMGHGEDAELRPEMCEHFGISTVEAMAAGCVPVVVNRGGQAEIVEHGRNGYVWDGIDEMLERTIQLSNDDNMLAKMSRTAQSRAERFNKQRFLRHFHEFVSGVAGKAAKR